MSEASGGLEPQAQKDIIPGQKFIEVNGIRVSYIERGNPQGEPFMYIGGWASSALGDKWFLDSLEGKNPSSVGFSNLFKNKKDSAIALATNVAKLKGKYRIIDLELPGFGKSEALKGKVDLDRMADFVADFQKKLGLEGSRIFASSMGGLVGIKLAAMHPEMARVLMLQGVMSKPDDMEKMALRAIKLSTSLPVRSIFKIPGIAATVYEFFMKTSKDFKMSSEEMQKAMIEGVRGADTKTAVSTLAEVGRDISESIAKVRCPVIIIDGIKAETVPFEKQEKMATKFHREIPDGSEKMTRTDEGVKLAISESFGSQGHTVVNTCPEALAVLVDKMSTRLLKEQATS